jgi:hypothetical protein
MCENTGGNGIRNGEVTRALDKACRTCYKAPIPAMREDRVPGRESLGGACRRISSCLRCRPFLGVGP